MGESNGTTNQGTAGPSRLRGGAARDAVQARPYRPPAGLLFINELCADFERHGAEAVRRVREESPLGYLRIIIDIMPREMEFDRPLAEVSVDELLWVIDLIREARAVAPMPTSTLPPDD